MLVELGKYEKISTLKIPTIFTMASVLQPTHHQMDHTKLPSHATQAPDAEGSDYSDTEEPIRAPGEKSPTTSLYDQDDSLGSFPQGGKEISFFPTFTRQNLLIVEGLADLNTVDPQRDATMYVANSIKPSSPSVTLIQGNTKGGTVLGVVNTSIISSSYKIGLGNPETSVNWSEMKRHGLVSKSYWSFNFEGQEFKWKRTHAKALGAGPSLRNKKLIDDKGNVLAVYRSNRLSAWKKMGKLTIVQDLGNDWHMLVLLTFLGLLEKERRMNGGTLMGMGMGAGGSTC
jgi:hypothetical protein